MTTTIKAAAISAATALALSGCASIVSGQTDHVRIDSSPPGKTCDVYQGRDRVAQVVTPQTIAVERSSKSLLVVCEGDRERVDDGFNGWTIGNLLLFPPFGTIIGFLVDGATYASRGYDDVTVRAGK